MLVHTDKYQTVLNNNITTTHTNSIPSTTIDNSDYIFATRLLLAVEIVVIIIVEPWTIQLHVCYHWQDDITKTLISLTSNSCAMQTNNTPHCHKSNTFKTDIIVIGLYAHFVLLFGILFILGIYTALY